MPHEHLSGLIQRCVAIAIRDCVSVEGVPLSANTRSGLNRTLVESEWNLCWSDESMMRPHAFADSQTRRCLADLQGVEDVSATVSRDPRQPASPSCQGLFRAWHSAYS